ncbi:unnamed protein product [Mytilus edulis]|uniref:Ion transport domain-containing protein n=1 Tax=Mytilus edulis TaxID=6550 RepID=A0A8S3SUS0_MYTED|nr:unnamed protein product [Mytilus edulis]
MEKEMKVKRGRKYSFLGTGETTDNIELLEKDMKKEMKARRSNMSRSMGTDESKKKIGIRHLLIACVILDEQVNAVDLDKFERKGLLRLKSEFSQIAIRITSNIDEKCTEKTENDDNPHKKHLGKNINHAERLLLNEGYIQWAIKKQNKDFINNNEVKKILNRMWYGTEDVDYKTIGFLCFLIAYAYMLLFDYRDNGITYSDYFIIAWMASFAVDEMKQFQDTFAFMVIMTIIMMCYNISFHALMYSNTEFSWLQIEKIAHNGFWILFGKLEDNSDSLTVPDCTFNKTIYEIGVLERCPTQLGKLLTPYLKAVYCLVAVVLLLNLLIAMYSDTFQKVHQETEFYWSQLQTDFLEEYSIKTAFPIHLQLLVIPATVVHAVMFVCYHFLRSKTENETNLDVHPMFVRGILYD